ncbi:helix-turn-helix domain-containing protein [Enterococcus casseliflavus]|uniref:helix-turn-helix domain-containing protein n=1 Tax=Enterococcus casseliflavus TaxID=37734 RepID=UPI00403CD1CE
MRDLQLKFLSNRKISRLFLLLSSIERDRIFTIRELAFKIKVTERTIASDINYIKEFFGDSIELISGNSGFTFDDKKPTLYREKKQQLLENEFLFEIIGNIFHGELKNVDEIAHFYHLSESTFRRLLTQTNPILNSYGLKWISNPLNIEGEEANLRKFFKDFYYEGIETKYTLVPDTKLHEMVLKKLKSDINQFMEVSGTTPAAFYYTFFIAIKRVSLGYNIEVPNELIKLVDNEKCFNILYSLKTDIENIYGVSLSKDEFTWVYLVSLCKRTLDRESSEINFYNKFNKYSEIDVIVEDYISELKISIVDYEKVPVFFRSFFLSRKINHLFAPVLNKEANDIIEAVRTSNFENYQFNLRFLMRHKNKLFGNIDNTEYIEDICSSLTIYSNLILDLYSPPKNIYFLLEGDHFICQQIQTRAKQLFGIKHTLTFLPLGLLTIETLNVSHIDLIITNYNRYVLDYIIETDYLLIKELPDEKDWDHLSKKINPYRNYLF